jgi:hypothetical protein
VSCSGGHSHQKQAKQEGPEGDSIRLCELRVHHRTATPSRGRLTGDRDRPPLRTRLGAQGNRLGRLFVDLLRRARLL